MTKKDYELIAKTLEAYMPVNHLDISYSQELEIWQDIVNGLAFEFENTNPKFNRSKFIEACGIEPDYCELCSDTVALENMNVCSKCLLSEEA